MRGGARAWQRKGSHWNCTSFMSYKTEGGGRQMRGGARTQHLPRAIQLHARTAPSPTLMDSTVVYTAALKLAARRPESLRLPPGDAASAFAAQVPAAASPSASAGHAVDSRLSGAARVCMVRMVMALLHGALIPSPAWGVLEAKPLCHKVYAHLAGELMHCRECRGQCMIACAPWDVDCKVTPGCISNLWLPRQGVAE